MQALYHPKKHLNLSQEPKDNSHIPRFERHNSSDSKLTKSRKRLHQIASNDPSSKIRLKNSKECGSRNMKADQVTRDNLFEKLMKFSVLSNSLQNSKQQTERKYLDKNRRKVTFKV